jgi:multidrug efflux system outer membrane protein
MKYAALKYFSCRVMAVSLVTSLVGCNLAPNYVRPATPVSQSWPVLEQTQYDAQSGKMSQQKQTAEQLSNPAGLSKNGPNANSAADVAWQDFFLDPRLRALIAIALGNNRDFRIAVARMDQAQALWGVQRGALFPQIGAGAGGVKQRQVLPSGSGRNVSTVTSLYQAEVGVTAFEIDLFGRLRNLSEAAFQQYLASAEVTRGVQISLVADTALNYLSLRVAQALLTLTEQTFQSRLKNYQLVLERSKAGVASDIALMQAKALLDSSAGDVAVFTREKALAFNALSVLIGQAVPNDLPPEMPLKELNLMAGIPAGMPSDLLFRRPDIRQAENLLLSANANIGAARAAFFPNISLTTSIGGASTSLGNLFSSGTGVWAFAPTVSIPIFTGGSLESNLSGANAVQRGAIAAYEKSIQVAFREVSDALAGEATYGSQLIARSSQAQSSQKLLNLSNARYFADIENFLQVQIAEVEYFTAQQQQVRTVFETFANRINFYKALGGGWDNTTPGAQYNMNAAIQDAEKRSPYPVASSGVNEVIQVNAVSAVK